MREIKFRVWDNTTKKMHYQDDSWNGSNGFINIVTIYTGYENSREWKDFFMMQYTGLKDKDGTEIYEGDIVEAWSEGSKHIGEVRERIDGLYIIYPAYCNGFWGLKPNKAGKTTVEVIGNIYENPELLEEV